MLKTAKYAVGPWMFVPSAHELRSGSASVRLQQRASATLSLLCERAGEVVRREEIVDRAWGRQHLSPNSVAIVIGDLRRAMAVPAGEPGSIETIPKAGYRLIVTPAQPEAQPHSRTNFLAIAAACALAALLVVAVLLIRGGSDKPQVAVGSVENAMGTNAHSALMRASGETVLIALGRHPASFNIVETPVPASVHPDYVLQQRWVLWSGDPELVLVARDRTGQTVWSGAIYGPENGFPAKISDRIGQFVAFANSHHH